VKGEIACALREQKFCNGTDETLFVFFFVVVGNNIGKKHDKNKLSDGLLSGSQTCFWY